MRLHKDRMLDFHQKIDMDTLQVIGKHSKDYLSVVNRLNNIGQLPPELFRSFFEAETLPNKGYFDQMNHIYLAATGLDDYVEVEKGTSNVLLKWKTPPRELMVQSLLRLHRRIT